MIKRRPSAARRNTIWARLIAIGLEKGPGKVIEKGGLAGKFQVLQQLVDGLFESLEHLAAKSIS